MIPLTDKTARELATTVAKTSDHVRVKVGRTNGLPVLHLVRSAPRERKVTHEGEPYIISEERASVTLKTAAEWSDHPWNKTVSKRRDRSAADFNDDIAIREAVANREAA